MRGAILIGLSIILALAALPLRPGSPALAHALLVSSAPPVDARLVDAPGRVTASFSEPLDPDLSSLQVLDGTGQQVDDGVVAVNPENSREMSVGLKESLPPGFYTVVWETLSTVDGHLLKGSFPFTLLNPDGSEPTGPRLAGFGTSAVSGGEPTAEVVSTRWVILTASVLLVGVLGFVVWVAGPAARTLNGEWERRIRKTARVRLAWVAWPAVAVLAIAGGAELVVQARQLGGLELVDKALDTFWGQRWIQRQAVLGAIAVSLGVAAGLWRRQRFSRAALWLALVGGLGYLLLLSMISHAGSVAGSFWAVASDFVHLVAAAVWVGMLVQLALLFLWSRRNLPDDVRPLALASHLQRFSALAATALILLLATGTFNAFAEVSSPEAMIDTAYGQVLTAKLALILPLLLVTAVNALALRPAIVDRARQAGGDGIEAVRRLLSRLVVLEAALAVAVLLVVAVLVQYPTSRQEEAAAEFAQASAEAIVGFEETEPAGELSVSMSIAPNAVGTNSFQVFVFPPPGEELAEILRVRLRFKPPDPTLGPSQVIAERVAPNFFKAVGAFFTQPGDWEVQVDLRRREVEDVSAIFRAPVAGAQRAQVGSRFELPLVAGSWTVVGAVGALLFGLIVWAGASQWPGLPQPAYPPLRVTRVAATVVGLALVIGVISGFIQLVEEAAPTGNPIEPTAQSIAIGRTLYLNSCAVCHGETGQGDGPLAETLEVPPADFRIHIPFHSDQFFFLVMTNGFGRVMPAFGDRLTEEERWHILNFLQSEFGLEAQQGSGGQ
ncbi:MAG: CopD family protein [Dehalococcoidia bacterium]